ncbi:extracellular solute-binding protein [Niameybacter massiliensis]|uniref:Extracellular solute-binding protein n=1 Tax=Holtiella tumoricola TaxID=3018743 RepID=A0AA42DLY9_9FIRM|nr:extracellular solute-binding protein [Holtiella tumoricola]MDA3731098.1 extracellular solute-binding protein [Holtiella tumoricola]
MKKFQKVLALGLAATMLGGVFVGCNSQPATEKPAEEKPATEKPAEEKPAEEPAAPASIRVVSMFGGTDPNAVTFDNLVAKYQDANPNVTVEVESATADETWKSNVLTDFAAGNEPDVLHFFTDVTSKTIVEQGKVVPISEIQSVYPDYASNINPAALKSATCPDGVQYAIPTHGYYEGIFVNTDLFEANGVDLPTDWAKLENAITAFAKTDITPIAVALGHIPHYWIEHLILAEGGVQDHSNKDITAVKESWVNGLSYFKKFNDMGAFPVDTATTQNDLVEAQFINKQAAMFLDGSWAVGKFGDTETVALLPIPGTGNGKCDGKQLISGFSSGFYITKKAWDDPAKREAAVKFVQSMTTTEAIGEMVTVAGGGAPAANVGDLKGLSSLGAKGAAMAGEATAVDGAIDGWLAKPAWEYLLSKVAGIAAGTEDPSAVVDQIITLNNAQ